MYTLISIIAITSLVDLALYSFSLLKGWFYIRYFCYRDKKIRGVLRGFFRGLIKIVNVQSPGQCVAAALLANNIILHHLPRVLSHVIAVAFKYGMAPSSG